MNYKMIFHTLGNLLKVEAALLLLPLLVSFIYQENQYWSFLLPIIILLAIGTLLTLKKPKNKVVYAREGFVIVGLSWVVMSLFGCLPFLISGAIPNFIDAFFETISGFTTTGASIVGNVEELSYGILFWRGFTHWIGGMGVLVFVLAILPSSGDNIHILRAEAPGPQVGKIVSKVRLTARILYLIYIGLTVLEIVLLVIGKMPVYDAIVHTFATAGTGGFSTKVASVGAYSHYCQIVIALFMIIFGINFHLFYLLLIGNIKQALKSEEVYWYFGFIIISTIIVVVNLMTTFDIAFGDALRDSFFQVSSIITTTGFATTDFNLWPTLSKTILIVLMFIGACAGSTGGGLKVSRVAILFKSIRAEIHSLLHPNSVKCIRFEGTTIDDTVTKGVTNYFALLIVIFIACTLLISIDGFSFTTNFTAVAACLNNTGPGLEGVGPMANYANYSGLSKIVLSFAMLVGRLEIYPILLLFSPKVWFSH